MTQARDLSQAADLLANARQVAVLTGAGVSKESGIPTFREAQTGLWARFNPEQIATPEAFRRDPDLVWSWYMYRAALVADATPNPGHLALAELETLVDHVAILTQNVDGLHDRAGSSDVVELHGRLGRYKCSDHCQGMPTIVDLASVPHDAEHAPACPHCNSLLRPDVVWFGETLSNEALQKALRAAHACDVMLVIGTSGLVHPAASLPETAKNAGARVIEINPDATPITLVVDVIVRGPSGEIMPQLISLVRHHRSTANAN